MDSYDRAAYEEARKAGRREYRRSVSAGRYPYLPALDTILGNEGTLREIPVGIMEIPLDLIVGTRQEERSNAFASNFMPLLDENTEFAVKWSRLYSAHVKEGIREAAQIYEYRRRFYVQEGNKRVSVLKYVKGAAITANVTRVMPKLTDSSEDRLYTEFLEFFKVCPIYDLEFSRPGDYRKFAALIGLDFSRPWTESQISAVKAAKVLFSRAFQARGGGDDPEKISEALLVYLQIYSLDSLLNRGTREIARRLDGLSAEIRTWLADDSIRRIDRADDAQNAPAHIPFFLRAAFTESEPLKAAFLYDRNPKNSSWIYGHELGRNHVENRFHGVVKTFRYCNCGTGESLAGAIDDAAATEGCQVIFTVSPVMMQETLRAAIRYPKSSFLNCSINMKHNAVRTYYSRMYEAKFLMGALASLCSETGRIGYRADYPIFGTVASINAFAIGAAMMNPNVRIFLFWATAKETDWRKSMKDAGVDVISGPDSIRPQDASREYGVYRISADGSLLNLAAPVWNWGPYYEFILRTVLSGSYDAGTLRRDDQAVNYYLGMADGVIDVVLSEKLPYYSRKSIHMLRDGIRNGTLNPFGGELRSQDGVVKKEGSPALSNEDIITMDWLNDNVTGRIPEAVELSSRAQAVTAVSGVRGKSAPEFSGTEGGAPA